MYVYPHILAYLSRKDFHPVKFCVFVNVISQIDLLKPLLNQNSEYSASKIMTSHQTKERSDKKVNLKLYSYFRSSCSWRVRIALEYKGIPYDVIPLQLMKNEQIDPKFITSVNPMGQVPALVVDDKHILLQSIAIIEFLDEVYPEKPLLPKDPLKRAKVREISELIASGIQPLQNLSVLHKHSDDPDEKLKWAQFWILRGLKALEKILQESAGKFCVGDDITMADCCIVPQVANAHRFKVDISSFPIIMRIDQALADIPAVQNAHASKQPDCPPEMYSKI